MAGQMIWKLLITIGVVYGAIAGYMGGRVDNIMMRFVDILYGLPYIVLVIILLVMFGRNTLNLFIALGAVSWLNLSRIVRGQVISLKTREFVEAARAIGVGRFSIIFRHLLRNTVGPVVVYVTLRVPAIILAEAFLSFLGLGVQPPLTSLGQIMSEGRDRLLTAWWLTMLPGAIIFLLALSISLIGDWLRDRLDPTLRGARR